MAFGAMGLFRGVAPLLIVLFGGLAAVVAFSLLGNKAYSVADPFAKTAKDKLDRSGIPVKTEQLVVAILVGCTVLWVGIMFVVRPPLLAGILILPSLLVVMFKLVEFWVDFRISQRQSKFINQLELVLRLMSGAIRAGMGIRQSMILVTQEMPDPARYEFNLVVMQTNIGVSVNDALGRLAQRMPGQETEMMTRAIITQTQTGGNLGKTLDSLAETIKQRRRIFRKVKALTAESRGSAFILGALPPLTFLSIMGLVPDFREPMFHSHIGHMGLAIAGALEVVGAFVLYQITRFKV